METITPKVSAVIPTRNRPDLVCLAVRSVLSQTIRDLECIVVIDGPDCATAEALAAIQDPRLRVLALENNVGGCEARNTGARAARSEWIALLDDDDEWLPQRLEKQLAAVDQAQSTVTMVASRFFDRGTAGELVRPHKFLGEGQNIAEYLWCEVSILGGIAGFPQTSTWLIRRDFLLEVPFTRGLKCLQDLDWLLHGFADPRMRVIFVEEPLAVFHNDYARNRLATWIDWRFSYRWVMENRALLSKKALGYFLVIYCVNVASQQGATWSELRSLLRDCFQYGRIEAKLLWLYCLYTLVYPVARKVIPVEQRKIWLYKVLHLVRALAALRSSWRLHPDSKHQNA